MFKRVFKSLSDTFTSREKAAPGASAPAKMQPAPEKKTSFLDRLGGTPAASEKKKDKKAAPTPSLSPEEMCGVTSSMNKDQIRARLSLLYRRHNRASSSLDAKLRAEAERMLNAIVAVREKHFGPI